MFLRLLAFALVFILINSAGAQWQQEQLSRGLVAVKLPGERVFISWRLLSSDPVDAGFNLYRHSGDEDPVRVHREPIDGATNIVDDGADTTGKLAYEVRIVRDGQESAPAAPVAVWESDYLAIPIKTIEGYRAGDASVGDLDGDGELEIVLHQVSRPLDNSRAGVTGEPILDAYELDGRHLWRINLGKNIREGEHYTQFMVYDLDGDGRAEVACKTADGTVDGRGDTIGDAEKDWRTLRAGSPLDGRVLHGPEYFTIFAGATGAALKTVDYIPPRGDLDGWGGIGGNAKNDSYGNRCERFLACVAYLDGRRPSVVMCRGVYGRTVLAAWDWRQGKLSMRWKFDTGVSYPPYKDASPFAGMGGHSLGVADVDKDGRDEIIYQAMVVDDDGRGLYSTGLRHGDAMHVTDIDPDRPGQEVFTVQENEDNAEKFQTPAAALRDARTGEILWSHSPTIDVGAGLVADIDPRHHGLEAWGGPGGLRDARGRQIGRAPHETDWCLWWDGDPLRELLSCGRRRFWVGRRPSHALGADRAGEQGSQDFSAPPRRSRRAFSTTRVKKWNWHAEREEAIYECDALAASRGPALVGDLIGDWREEMLLVSPDGQSLRLYTTTIPTEIRLATLLDDRQYRLALAWQNVAYNKPPHPSFYFGEGMSSLPQATDAEGGQVEVARPAKK